ncbi:hypothetical protein ACTFUH_003439 [Vibrio cholerae]
MSKKEIKPKSRSVYYHRAQFLKTDSFSVDKTLEEMLNQAWDQLYTTPERTFYAGDEKSLVGMKRSSKIAKLSKGNKDCTVFSIGTYEAGASANTIPDPNLGQVELEADTIDAPEDREFLDGEGFVCVYGNHIFMSPAANLRAGNVNGFMESMLIRGGFDQAASAIEIHQIADIDKVNTIEEEGVKNIVVNASTYLSSLEYIKRVSPGTKTPTLLRKFTNMVKSQFDLFCDDDTDAVVIEKSGINTKIVVSHDSRVSGDDARQGHEKVKETAKLLAGTDVSGYTIITKKGTTLTHDDLVLKRVVSVPRHGKTVHLDKMWLRLVEVLEAYERKGILEQ